MSRASGGPVTVAAVVGTGRSGSTLLALLLDAHPDVATVGEATGPPPQPGDRAATCSCGARLDACAFWTKVRERMAADDEALDPFAWGTRFELGRGWADRALVRSLHNSTLDAVRDAAVLATPGWGRRLRAITRRNDALMTAVLEVTGARVFLETSKDPRRVVFLRALGDHDLRIIHLVRDPLGYAGSRVKNRDVPPAQAARHWRRMAAQVERLWNQTSPQRRIRLRYEDLCTDTAAQLGRLTDFLGVSALPSERAFGAGVEHHIIGNRMRLSADQVTLDTSWRARLSESEVRDVRRLTRRSAARLGYGWPSSDPLALPHTSPRS